MLGGEIGEIEIPDTPDVPTDGKVLFEGEHQLEYVDGGSLLFDADMFSDIDEGSVLVVEAEKMDAQLAGWWYHLIVYINEPWTKIAELTDTLPLVYTLTSDDVLMIKDKGIQIQGHGVIVSKVMITTAGANGITTIYNRGSISDSIYTLNGIKMSQSKENLPKGVYIIGNKKFVIR